MKVLFLTKLLGSKDELYVASEDIEQIKRLQYDNNTIYTVNIEDKESHEDDRTVN
jgi:hypothetical protein